MPPQQYFADAYSSANEAAGCTGSATVGAQRFRTFYQNWYGGLDWGVYNCVGVSGHSQGRAWDWGGWNSLDPAQSGPPNDAIQTLGATDEYGNAHALARRLGVFYIIWNNTIWSTSVGPFSPRIYSPNNVQVPCNPLDATCLHENHVHFSFTNEGGAAATTGFREMYTGPSGIAAVGQPENIYYRGIDNALRQLYRVGNAWAGPSNLVGVLSSGPSATSFAAGRIDTFVRGSDNLIYHKYYDPCCGWVGYGSIGAPPGGALSGPSASSWQVPGNHHVDVFARSGPTLFVKTYDVQAGGWGGWSQVSTSFVTSDPAALSLAAGSTHVFVRGTDTAVYFKARTGSTWSPWYGLGGSAVGGPALGSPNADTLYVAVRGVDDLLWERVWTQSALWTGWASRGAPPGGLAGDPSIHMSGSGPRYVARGTDGLLWESTGGAWTAIPNSNTN